jgi:hypothetical protein
MYKHTLILRSHRESINDKFICAKINEITLEKILVDEITQHPMAYHEHTE